MNIDHLARTLIGDVKPQVQDATSLELRPGQIVRGVVLRMMDGQEAIVSINGTPVRARLETPLQAGQATWLQVQPEQDGGSLILRSAVERAGAGADSLIIRLMQQLGLKDTPLHREMLRQANDLGVQLGAKDARALSAFLLRHEAVGGDASRWMQSAIIALQRGLPLTQQIVQSIGQAVHGTPLPQQLTALQQLLAQYTAAGNAGPSAGEAAAGVTDATRQLLGRLSDAVSNWLATARGGMSQQAEAATRGASQQAVVTPSGTAEPLISGRSAAAATVPAGEQADGSRAAQLSGGGIADRQAAAARIASAVPPIAQPVAAAGMPSSAPEAASARAMSEQTSASRTTGQDGAAPLPTSASGNMAALDGSSVRLGGTGAWNGSLMRQLLQALGMGHEHELLDKLILQQQTAVGRGDTGPAGMNAATMSGGNASSFGQPALLADDSMNIPLSATQHAATSTDTVKALLLQTAANEQLPAALREALQQAAQTITGQQLLLTADRGMPLHVVTLFVPFLNEQGEHMASVHIQARGSKRGQLDADNCHLFFDLRMSALGETMVDVQITDRILALRIYNDHPSIQQFVDTGREDLQQAFEKMGYRLTTFHAMPLPTRSETEANADDSMSSQMPEHRAKLTRYAAGNAYRGVDLRI